MPKTINQIQNFELKTFAKNSSNPTPYVKEMIQRVAAGKAQDWELKELFSVNPKKLESINFREIYLYPENPSIFFNLLAQTFGRNSGYYSGYPEYDNEYFRSFVNDLGKIDLDNPNMNNTIENRIMDYFILAHLTLDKVTKTTNTLHEHFKLHFMLKSDTNPESILELTPIPRDDIPESKQKEKHPKVIKAIKSLDKTCDRYCRHLEKKIDFDLIQKNLYTQQAKQTEIDTSSSEQNNEKISNLAILSECLNVGRTQEFWLELCKYTPQEFVEKHGCSIDSILNINKPYATNKLYGLFKLKFLLQNTPLNSVEKFRTDFNHLKPDLLKHPDKKERAFIQKLEAALKNIFLIPYKIYSKHSILFWKSRVDLLEAKLTKTEKIIAQSSARPC